MAVAGRANSDNARLFELVAELKRSPYITRLPPDQVLIDTLRDHLLVGGASLATRPANRRNVYLWIVVGAVVLRLILLALRGGC
jgi:hypothetical protein